MSEAAHLLAALDAAPDQGARTALVSRCTHEQLLELHAALAYRRLNATVAEQLAAFETFTRELDSALDDAERLQLIETAIADPHRGQTWLQEWSWRRGASLQAWHQRCMALIGAEVAS
jgi:hypothetical protein